MAVCGRRWGKTTLGLICTVRGHGPLRGALRGAIDGGNIWWVAADYKSANDVIWPSLVKSTHDAWIRKSEQDFTIWLPGGGTIAVRSADKEDALRGPGLDGLVLDEAAFAKERVYKEILRPMLSDRGGWALLIGTPNGFNWYHELFQRAGGDDHWAAWQRPSWENPLITPEEIEQAKRELGPRAFAQEFGAEFVSIEGAEFPPEYFEGNIWFDEWPRQQAYRCLAIDPSKGRDASKGDYSAIVKAVLSSEGLLYVDADLERRPAEQIVQDAVRHYREFQPDAFGIETNQFQELLATMFSDAIDRVGLPGMPVAKLDNRSKKEVRIRRLGEWFYERRVRFKRDSAGALLLLSQLREFPVGKHDDGPDALEMCIQLLDQWALG